MKVLQINSVCGIGSTGRIATDLHHLLIGLGHDSRIAYGRDIPHNCNAYFKIGTKYDNYRHLALTRIFDKHGLGSKKPTQDFIKQIEMMNPDIIHLHNIHGYYINIKILFDYLKKSGKPIIWTLHDCWAFTGHCAHFDYDGCDRWKTGCFSCPQKKNYPSSILFDNSKDNFSIKKDLFTGMKNMTIVTPSRWLAELVKESFLGVYPVKVIHNGVDQNFFKPTASDFREKFNIKNKFIILGVANVWDERKGYYYFLELSKIIDKDSRIVLVGLNDKQLKNLPENIIGIKRTNNIKELAEICSAADVFVNPTLEDNFPTTNLEALACGTPVITFRTGGSPESIDSQCGIVTDKGDMNQLVDSIHKIRELHIDQTLCVNRAKHYGKNNMFLNYLDLYQMQTGGSPLCNQ